MKKTLLATLVGATAMTSSFAQAELSANASLTSNYLWRGITQTDNGPAIQAGLDYANESGFYAGTWASNIDFGDDADFELDLYAGYAGTAGEWEYDVGYVLFMYPGEDYDFGEIYANFTKGALTVGAAVFANGWEGTSFADTLYVSADYGLDVIEGFDVSIHAGYWLEGYENSLDLGASIGKDFWSVGASMATEGDDELKIFASVAWDFAL